MDLSKRGFNIPVSVHVIVSHHSVGNGVSYQRRPNPSGSLRVPGVYVAGHSLELSDHVAIKRFVSGREFPELYHGFVFSFHAKQTEDSVMYSQMDLTIPYIGQQLEREPLLSNDPMQRAARRMPELPPFPAVRLEEVHASVGYPVHTWLSGSTDLQVVDPKSSSIEFVQALCVSLY